MAAVYFQASLSLCSLPGLHLHRLRTKCSCSLTWCEVQIPETTGAPVPNWKCCIQPHTLTTIKASRQSQFLVLKNHFRLTQGAYSALPQNSYCANNKLFDSFLCVSAASFFDIQTRFWVGSILPLQNVLRSKDLQKLGQRSLSEICAWALLRLLIHYSRAGLQGHLVMQQTTLKHMVGNFLMFLYYICHDLLKKIHVSMYFLMISNGTTIINQKVLCGREDSSSYKNEEKFVS